MVLIVRLVQLRWVSESTVVPVWNPHLTTTVAAHHSGRLPALLGPGVFSLSRLGPSYD